MLAALVAAALQWCCRAKRKRHCGDATMLRDSPVGWLIVTMNGARRLRFCAPQKDHIGLVDPHALKIPARRAENALAESTLSPVQAEPTQVG